MTLAALQTKDRATANSILAAAALATTADSEVSNGLTLIERYGQEAEQLVSEIRRNLKLSPDDSTPHARRAIDDVILSEMRNSYVSRTEEAEALARAAQAGKLPPSLYAVETMPSFAQIFEPLGLRLSHVVSAVRNPDEYQHLLSHGALETEVVSLFLRKIVSRQASKSHWLLIQTHRQQFTQIVQSAWRIFPQDIDLTHASEPLDLLQALVNEFGVPFSLNGSREKFINSQEIEMGADAKIEFPGGPEYFASASHALNANGITFKVGLIYCIDIPKYRRSLAAHL